MELKSGLLICSQIPKNNTVSLFLSHCSMRALPPSKFLTISVSDIKSSSLCEMMVMAVPCTLIVDFLSFGITAIPSFDD